MGTRVDFSVALVDRVTGPAKAVTSSLGKITAAADAVNKTTRGRKADPIAQVAKSAQVAKKEASDLGGVLGTVKGKLLAVGAALGVVALGEAFIGGVASAQRFKEDSQLALATLLKSGEAATDAQKRMRKIAGDLALDPRAAIGGLVELVGKGFKVEEIERMTKSLADLKVVSPNVDPSRIIGGISKIKSTGYLQGDELNILVEAGVSASGIYEALSKKLGKTVAEVQKLKQAGKISANDAIEAILTSVNQTTGGRAVGEVAAERARTTISGTIDMIKSRWGSLLLDLDTGTAGTTVLPFLGEVASTLDVTTERGGRLKGALEKAFQSLTGPVADLLGAKGGSIMDGLVSGVEYFADIISTAMPGVVAFTKSFFGELVGVDGTTQSIGAAFKEWVSTFLGNGDLMATLGRTMAQDGKDLFRSISSAAQAATAFLKAIAPLVAIVAKVANATSAMSAAVSGAVEDIKATVLGALLGLGGDLVGGLTAAGGTVVTEAVALGTSIIDGITSGVRAGAQAVADEVKSVASGAIASAKATLGIKSPSKVFEGLGIQTMQGFARGVAMNDVGGPMASILQPPSPAAARSAGEAAGGRGMGGGVHFHAGAIVINGAANAEDLVAQIKRVIRREFEDQAMADGLLAGAA